MRGEFGFFKAVGEKPTGKPLVCRLAAKKQCRQSGFRSENREIFRNPQSFSPTRQNREILDKASKLVFDAQAEENILPLIYRVV